MVRTAQLVHTIDVTFYEIDSFWYILLPHNFDFIVILVNEKEKANSGHCRHTDAHPLVNDMYARKFFCREMNAYFFWCWPRLLFSFFYSQIYEGERPVHIVEDWDTWFFEASNKELVGCN